MAITFTCLVTIRTSSVKAHLSATQPLTIYIDIDIPFDNYISTRPYSHNLFYIPTSLHISHSSTGKLGTTDSTKSMATLIDPTLGDATESVVVDSNNPKDFKQHLAKFIYGGSESGHDAVSHDEVESEEGLEIPKRREPSTQNPAKHMPIGTKNENKQSNKRKTVHNDEEHDEQKLPPAPKRREQPTPPLFGRALRIARYARGRKSKSQTNSSVPVGRKKVNWPDFAAEFSLRLSGDSKKVSNPPSRDLRKKQRHIKGQLAFHLNGVGVVVERPLLNGVEDKIAKLEKIASKKKLKQDKQMKKLGGDGVDDSPWVRGPKKGQKKARIPYIDSLRQLPKKPATQEQIDKIEHSESMGPRFVGRTVSNGRGDRYAANMTNGFTAQDLLLPSADTWEEHRSHARLTDLNQGEIILMTGQHLAWADCRHDEFLSYSKDLLFLLVHALNRFHSGQKDVTIQYINCDKATSPDGRPAAFYNALDIYGTFEIDSWPGWSDYNHEGLHPRKFTHEYLSHGIIKHNDPTLKQARLVDLIRDGLFELMPALYAPFDHWRTGLYTAQVVYRKLAFPPRTRAWNEHDAPIYSYDDCPRTFPLTTDILSLVRKLALDFIVIPTGADPSTVEPPLHIFLQFLTLCKREKADPVLEAWIKDHYDANAVSGLYQDAASGLPLPGFTTVADNIPGYMQYLDLVRDCISVFALAPLPANDVCTAHPLSSNTTMDHGGYAAEDFRLHGDDWTTSHLDPKA